MALKVDKLQDIANQTILNKKCYANMFHIWSLEATNIQRLIHEVLVICGQLGSQEHHLKENFHWGGGSKYTGRIVDDFWFGQI